MSTKTITATVYVRLKREVLDPQGSAVARALTTMGIGGVRDVRIGKLVELELDSEGDRATLEDQLARIADGLLANPVIEDYEIAIDAP
jgi:phosphoribosylformylglycinamidine synthase PurS subunit